MKLTRSQILLIALLKRSLWNKVGDETAFFNADRRTWREVVDLASVQGVLALAYDGLEGLPDAGMPPKELLVGWAISVKKIETRYSKQREILGKLAKLFSENGINTLGLKGIGLSMMYPVPSHREGGDIDIYLWDGYEKGNKLFIEKGVYVDCTYEKHASFYFEGIPVENHYSFLDVKGRSSNLKLEKRLQCILEEEGIVEDEKLGTFFPKTVFNAIFLLKHAQTHFLESGIVLRFLSDWALLLNQKPGLMDNHLVKSVLDENGLVPFANAFSRLAANIFQPPFIIKSVAEPNAALEVLIWSEIMRYEKNENLKADSITKKILSKVTTAARLFRNRRKFELIGTRKLFWEEVSSRIRFNLYGLFKSACK